MGTANVSPPSSPSLADVFDRMFRRYQQRSVTRWFLPVLELSSKGNRLFCTRYEWEDLLKYQDRMKDHMGPSATK
ncbi:hypothetical protein Trydic_g7789 [Trypoxylus dichotomus]